MSRSASQSSWASYARVSYSFFAPLALLAVGLGLTLGLSEVESVIVLDKPHLVSL